MQVSRYLFVVVFWICSACQTKLRPDEYVHWVKDAQNGLHKTKIIGDLSIDALYKPIEYALLEQIGDSLKDGDVYRRKKEELGNMIYIDLEISSKGGDIAESQASSLEELQQMMYYLSFDFAKDITLSSTHDTSNCELFHFLRTYKIGNKRKFLLGFPKKGSFVNEDLTLSIDSDLFSVGQVKIIFNKEDINNLPNLKI